MYTRLDIVNEMIGATGARLLTAEQTRHPLYQKASKILDRVIKSVLSYGLYFNTEVRDITPQSDGTVIVPQGCIKADPVDRVHDLVLRDQKLYDRTTGEFFIAHKPIKLRMYFKLDIQDIPLEAQEYIRTKCVHDFYVNEDGSGPKVQVYKEEQRVAWSNLHREHIRNRQTNARDNPSNTINRLRKGVGFGRYRNTVGGRIE